MTSVTINNISIGDGYPCFVIAEIGINHNGSVEIAKRLIDAAVSAGCNAVKFQKRTVDVVYTKDDLSKKRQVPPDNGIMINAVKRGVLSEEATGRLRGSDYEETTNGDLKYALEFTAEEYTEIDSYCKDAGIMWFASPWDEESVDFLEDVGVPCYKIASATLTDEGVLQRVKEKGKPIILSTGMSTIEEIHHAVDLLDGSQLILMHSVSTYPTQDRDLNLKVINLLKREFPDVPVGYSGHEKGILPSVYAVAFGACCIERHLTLDKRMWGTDQAASVEPEDLKRLISDIRNLEDVAGKEEKIISPEEMQVMLKLRRKYY